MTDRDWARLEEDLRGMADEVFDEWSPPGLALASIAEEDSLTLSFGHGDVATNADVSASTIFAIGSATKAFTTLGLALLVDEGRLDWDRPIRECISGFRMMDSFATERMTVRDLVTHRCGLSRHDLVWYRSSLSRREMLRCLQFLPPTCDFRAAFQYQNLMYMAAGYLVEELTGSSWEEFTNERIIAPLRLERTTCAMPTMAKDSAKPYTKIDGALIELQSLDLGAVAPAGCMYSTAADMASWVQFLLTGKNRQGRVLVSEAIREELIAPQIVLRDAGKVNPALALLDQAREVNCGCYGMGWFIHSYRGAKMVHHGGRVNGFSSYVAYLPEERVGVVALCNCNSSPAPLVVALKTLDRLLGLDGLPWGERMRDIMSPDSESADSDPPSSLGRSSEASGRPLTEHVGDYNHQGYGRFQIALDEQGLIGLYHGVSLRLSHLKHDVFLLQTSEASLTPVAWPKRLAFVRDFDAMTIGLKVRMDESSEAILFERCL